MPKLALQRGILPNLRMPQGPCPACTGPSIEPRVAQIFLQHRTLHGDFHFEREGAVAIFVIDNDGANHAFTEMHVGLFAVLLVGGDPQTIIAERMAQEFLQLTQFLFVHERLQPIEK